MAQIKTNKFEDQILQIAPVIFKIDYGIKPKQIKIQSMEACPLHYLRDYKIIVKSKDNDNYVAVGITIDKNNNSIIVIGNSKKLALLAYNDYEDDMHKLFDSLKGIPKVKLAKPSPITVFTKRDKVIDYVQIKFSTNELETLQALAEDLSNDTDGDLKEILLSMTTSILDNNLTEDDINELKNKFKNVS